MQSQSEENYLKAIYLLAIQGEKVTPTLLAKSLGNNPASVVDMLKKLSNKKLIVYNKIKGASLKSDGLKSALRMVRRHRLWEMFLNEKLGYAWDEVHDIAEQLEHVQGSNLDDRLDKFLDFPQFDPHGEAIPRANGSIAKISFTSLFEIEPGKVCKVVSVKDTSKLFLQYLDKLNIQIGARIKVIEKIDFDGSLMINVNKTKALVSSQFAKSIFVA